MLSRLVRNRWLVVKVRKNVKGKRGEKKRVMEQTYYVPRTYWGSKGNVLKLPKGATEVQIYASSKKEG